MRKRSLVCVEFFFYFLYVFVYNIKIVHGRGNAPDDSGTLENVPVADEERGGESVEEFARPRELVHVERVAEAEPEEVPRGDLAHIHEIIVESEERDRKEGVESEHHGADRIQLKYKKH